MIYFLFWMHDIEFSSKSLFYVYLLLLFGRLSWWIMVTLRRTQWNLLSITLLFSYQDLLKCGTTCAFWYCMYGRTYFKIKCFISLLNMFQYSLKTCFLAVLLYSNIFSFCIITLYNQVLWTLSDIYIIYIYI